MANNNPSYLYIFGIGLWQTENEMKHSVVSDFFSFVVIKWWTNKQKKTHTQIEKNKEVQPTEYHMKVSAFPVVYG